MGDKGERWSILQPVGYNASTCGYCGGPGKRSSSKSSRSYGLWAHQISPRVYKLLIERGWRRSGSYLYKPDLAPGRSCCPAYTIRCDAEAFQASKGQKKVVRRFVRFVKEGRQGGKGFGEAGGQVDASEERTTSSMDVEFPAPKRDRSGVEPPAEAQPGPSSSARPRPGPSPARPKPKDKAFDLATSFEEAETYTEGDKHRFQIVYEPAEFTDEKYRLYEKYQLRVHNDPPSKVTTSGFDRFLCKNPFHSPPPRHSTISDRLAHGGAFHARYLLDGRLIAFAVLDVLPDCVSSVYFVWDPDFHGLGLGKVGALREIAMTRELGRRWYCMGFYIHSCVKMRYKGQYGSSSLLDPYTYEWHPLEAWRPKLDANKHAAFADVETALAPDDRPATEPEGSEGSSSEEDEEMSMPRDPLPAGIIDPDSLSSTVLRQTFALEPGHGIVPILTSTGWKDAEKRGQVREGLAAVGEELASEVLWFT